METFLKHLKVSENDDLEEDVHNFFRFIHLSRRTASIPFELWTVAMETYFAESAKNCEQQSFAPVN